MWLSSQQHICYQISRKPASCFTINTRLFIISPSPNTHYTSLNKDLTNKALKKKQSEISVLLSFPVIEMQRVDASFQTALPSLICLQSLDCHITDTPETKRISFSGFVYSFSVKYVTYDIRWIWKRDVLSCKSRIIAFEKWSHGSIKEHFEANPHSMLIYSPAFQLARFSQ